MAFNERLREAARHAGVEWSQTAVAKALGYTKQTVDRWFGTGEPKPAQIYNIADRWKVDARWLATGEGDMAKGAASDHAPLSPLEELLLEMFSHLTPEQQREQLNYVRALYNANRITQRFAGARLRTISNEEVERAFGKIPPPKPPARPKRQRRKGFHEEDPE
jgi:transcriptional regulator with XRE-family HTH domain